LIASSDTSARSRRCTGRATGNHVISDEDTMRFQLARGALVAAVTLAGACGEARSASTAPTPSASLARSASSGARQGFSVHGTASGFPTGAVFLTGGGSYDLASASNVIPGRTRAAANGGFRCTDPVAQGPFGGCAAGEGVRWETVHLLASASFKCSASDAPKLAVTSSDRVVLLADFYRAGDGVDESFTAQMIVSETDLAPNVDGVQTLWIQGVGCGDAVAHFAD
jgi:hypothetical protein